MAIPMKIRTWIQVQYHDGRGRQWVRRPHDAHYDDGGYPSVRDMRRELRRRFGDYTEIEDIPNGVRVTDMRGPATIQEVTLEV